MYLLFKYFNTRRRLLFLASLNICYLQIYNLNLTFDCSIKYNMEIDVTRVVISYVDVHVKQHVQNHINFANFSLHRMKRTRRSCKLLIRTSSFVCWRSPNEKRNFIGRHRDIEKTRSFPFKDK